MTERTQEEIVKDIVEILENYVAPAVASHGGEVNFSDYNDGTVILEMSGACSGCAGSTMTLKMGVEGILTEMVPEVQRVEGFDDPFSQVDPFYTDPFMTGMIDMEYIEDRDIDSNN
jgi:Fe-S cluster biogenesis protein NfuA